MRPSVLEHGHRLRARMFIRLVRLLSRQRTPQPTTPDSPAELADAPQQLELNGSRRPS